MDLATRLLIDKLIETIEIQKLWNKEQEKINDLVALEISLLRLEIAQLKENK